MYNNRLLIDKKDIKKDKQENKENVNYDAEKQKIDNLRILQVSSTNQRPAPQST